jgi:hypothetical protein
MTIQIKIDPKISPDQLFDFYARNNICETGFGKDVAAKVLSQSALIVGAFENERLVGIARATFDGLTAAIMELSLDCGLQGDTLLHRNGSIIERDHSGEGRVLGRVFVDELVKRGATFIFAAIEPCESDYYRSIGFQENSGQLSYFIDCRPYVLMSDRAGIMRS